MIDVIIPLGSGSVYDDLELRYALRSIQQYLKGYRRIYIIGQLPKWCHNVVHLPYPDKSKYKQKNIVNKIIHACQQAEMSEDFMFFNDDHYLLEDMISYEMPFFASGTIESEIVRSKGEYRRSLVNTLTALRDLSTWNFDCHYPILYNKDKFQTVMSLYDWNVPDGYVIKSLYCNTLNHHPVPIKDCKIHDYMPQAKISEFAESRICISTANHAITNPMKRALEGLFPEKSIYEW